MQPVKRYHPLLVTLHWLTVIVMLGAGFLSEDEGASPISIHMILGAILLVFMIVRLVVRFTTQRPPWADAGNQLLNKVGELTHLGLYLGTFFILGLGGVIAMNRNLIAYALGTSTIVREGGFITKVHHLGWLMALALIALHVGAAFYHQFIKRDNLLARMWYGA